MILHTSLALSYTASVQGYCGFQDVLLLFQLFKKQITEETPIKSIGFISVNWGYNRLLVLAELKCQVTGKPGGGRAPDPGL